MSWTLVKLQFPAISLVCLFVQNEKAIANRQVQLGKGNNRQVQFVMWSWARTSRVTQMIGCPL